MSNTKNRYEKAIEPSHGGPAFPSLKTTVNKSPGVYTSEVEPGMTLRDHFAGLAMQAILGSTNTPSTVDTVDVARDAYVMADDMLKARDQ